MTRGSFKRGLLAGSPFAPAIFSASILFAVSGAALGLPTWSLLLSSLLINTGTAQFMSVELLNQGANWVLVAVACLLVNLRFAIYSMHLTPITRQAPLFQRLLFLAFLTDEAYAMTGTRLSDSVPKQEIFSWASGILIATFLPWQLGTLTGALLGRYLPRWDLSITIPLTLLTCLILLLNQRDKILVACVAATAALLARGLPFHLGLPTAVGLGIATGSFLEYLARRRKQTPKLMIQEDLEGGLP